MFFAIALVAAEFMAGETEAATAQPLHQLLVLDLAYVSREAQTAAPAAQTPPPPAPASPAEPARSAPRNMLQAGLGYTSSPDAFLWAMRWRRFLGPGISLGPLLQVATSDDDTLVAPTLNVGLHVPFPKTDQLSFIGEFGAGFAYIEKDDEPGDDDDLGGIINFGIGLRYAFPQGISLGSEMLFNVLPDEIVDENFFFAWQVVTIGVEF